MCCVMGYTGHDLSAAKFKDYLLRTVMRGPDDQRVVEGPFGLMGFGRLAIMGLTPEGMQPFYRGADCVVCNGELYGFRFEKEILKRRGYKFQSDCDCEILLPLYYEYGLDMFRHLDAEFARQLVEVAVDGGGVGAGALGLQMFQNIRRTDRVLPVVDEIIQDELPGFGVVSAATCHDIRLPFCIKCITIYPSMQNKMGELVTSTKNFVNNARKYGRISVQNGKAPNLLEKLL